MKRRSFIKAIGAMSIAKSVSNETNEQSKVPYVDKCSLMSIRTTEDKGVLGVESTIRNIPANFGAFDVIFAFRKENTETITTKHVRIPANVEGTHTIRTEFTTKPEFIEPISKVECDTFFPQ